MSMDVAIALLIGLVVAGAGAVLLLFAAWMRRGRSSAARFRALKVHVYQARYYAVGESLALAWTPLLGQTSSSQAWRSPSSPCSAAALPRRVR